jgi:hypothetical protein
MNKNIYIAIGVIVVILVAGFFWMKQSEAPTAQAPGLESNVASTADTTEAIDADISSIDLGSPDADFGDIDKDINSL